MSVRALWSDGTELLPARDGGAASGEPFSALLRTALRCNNAIARRGADGWQRGGDPSESALLVAAGGAGRGRRVRAGRARRGAPRALPLRPAPEADDDARRGARRSALVPRQGGAAGAARALRHGTRQRGRQAALGCRPRRGRRGVRALRQPRDCASSASPSGARRVRRRRPRPGARRGSRFVGLIALEDPPRPDVVDAVARCRSAGDPHRRRHRRPRPDRRRRWRARSGIVGEAPTVLTGAEVDAMAEPELDRLLRETAELIVARSNPETKLHLVDALEAEGHTVAMTGDGVNDAPALRRADIGVAMGESGTDVAREAATMVLTDDNFASIVAAIEEGRVVYENIRKFVTYIFAHATPGGRPLPDLRPLRRCRAAAADGPADPRHRSRHRDPAGAGARARAGRAGHPRPAAAPAQREHRQSLDADPGLALAGPARGGAGHGWVLHRADRRPAGLPAIRPAAAPPFTTTTWWRRR